jgi:hypothetical protein
MTIKKKLSFPTFKPYKITSQQKTCYVLDQYQHHKSIKRRKIQDLDATPIDNIPNMYTDFAYDYIQTLKKIQALPHQ